MTEKKNTTKNKSSKKAIKIPKKYQKIIDGLENDFIELKNKNVRLLAEFDNYKKRNDFERLKLIKYEGMAVIKPILSVLDDLDRTMKIPGFKKNKTLYEGINMIGEKLSSILSEIGVSPFDSIDEEFNIDYHEALMVKKSKKKSNTIIEEFEKGYVYHDKVIRHAKVVVSK